MRRTVTLLVTALVLAAVPVATGCSEPGTAVVDGEGILGTYTVNGIDVRGEEYSGTVVIDATEVGDEYLVRWLITGTLQEGIGTLTGNEFEVEWTTISAPGGDASGTARYVLADNGDFIGTRTIDGVDGVGTETIFQKA
ncbi:MAG: hypothetical protein R2707_08435 [Acidimicrobiales bacterium]